MLPLGTERSASEVLDAFCAELDAIAAEVHRTHVEVRERVELAVLSPYGCRERLAEEIGNALLAERDPEGRAPVQAIHRFTRTAESGRTWIELRFALSESWRTEPNALLGGLRFEKGRRGELELASPFSKNTSVYAGDYDSSTPEGAPGFFFSTHCYRLDAVDAQHFRQPWKGSAPEMNADLPKLSVLRVAPTLLRRLGAKHSARFDAEPLGDRAR